MSGGKSRGKYSNTNNGFNPYAGEGPNGSEPEGDSYSSESPLTEERWSPGSVGTMHRNSDVDSSTFSQHHTLGPRHNQSSPGDHSHDGATSKNIGAWTNWAQVGTS